MVARVLAPARPVEAPKPPPEPSPIAQAMNAVSKSTEEAARIIALLAQRLGSKRTFITEVVEFFPAGHKHEGRIKSLRTVEQ